jgi:hypothetical protein
VLSLLLAALLPSLVPARPAAAAAAPAPSSGYWMTGADGSVYAFGAPALGSMAGRALTRPVVGLRATTTGQGYWLVAADGAVFAFGDARFLGSTGNLRITHPVVGMASTPSGGGYWLVASDGGVFAFGDARFLGSTGGARLNRPIVGMAPTPSGGGYWLVADDGGVFAFGDARFLGSTGNVRLNRPIVGIAASPTAAGYTLVASDGGVFMYGDARYAGSAAGAPIAAPIVGMAVDPIPRLYVPGQRGYDISWPQCGSAYPARPFDIAVVGVNDGHPFSTNPCLVDQATRWASAQQLDVYLNLNRPTAGFTGGCAPADTACIATAFGRQAAQSSIATVRSAGLAPRVWWLDIEGPTTWDPDPRLNALNVQGAVDALQAAGLITGIYGTRYQWGVITGGYATRSPLPLWAAGSLPLQRCNEPFAGGYVVLSQVLGQYTASGYDEDAAC